MNFPKRVPVLAKPQEGSSIRNVSSAANTLSLVDASMRTSLKERKITTLAACGHGFLGASFGFRTAKPFDPGNIQAKRVTGRDMGCEICRLARVGQRSGGGDVFVL